MRHTLSDVSFEIPDDLQDFSDYSFSARDESAMVRFEIAREEADADALLAFARSHYEGAYGPAIIYAQPTTFRRGGGASVPGVEGEQRDPSNEGGERLRYALAAIASPSGRAVAQYNCRSRPNALELFRHVLRTTFILGEPSADLPRTTPRGWERRQANLLIFAIPARWTGPSTLLFRSDIELRITVAEPAVPPGAIDPASLQGPASGFEPPRGVAEVRTDSLRDAGYRGWASEWLVGPSVPNGSDAAIVRKACLVVGDATVLTAYARAATPSAPRLPSVWAAFLASVRPTGGVR
jgi:hypothetical protein